MTRSSAHLTRRVAKAAAARQADPKSSINRQLCGYLRLSVDREGNKIGYEIQKADIQAWAKRNGFTIGRWYQDSDISAADLKKTRPQFEQMLLDVAAGAWGGIVVWRLDRLVRLTREFERCYKPVEDSGGFIAAITGEFALDTRHEGGLFLMRLMVWLAESEIKAMRIRNKAHQAAKAEKGMYKGGGPRPFGYVGTEVDENGEKTNYGRKEIGRKQVPHEIILLKEAARRIATEGWGWSEVITDWHSRTPPVYGATGKPWTVLALQRVLTGPRAIGRREYIAENSETGELEGRWADAEWDGFIDEETWNTLNSMISTSGDYGPKERYLLSGIVRCGRCSMPLTGVKRRYEKQGEMTSTLTYRCKSGVADKVKGCCGKLSVLADDVEKLVIARVLTRLERSPKAIAALGTASASVADQIAVANAAIEACDAELADIARQRGALGLTDDEWLAARGPVVQRQKTARTVVAHLSKSIGIPEPGELDRQNLLAWFETLTLQQRRKLVSLHVAHASVSPAGRRGRYFDPGRVEVRLAEA